MENGARDRASQPGRLHETPGYHHVTVTDRPQMVFLAGQCPLDGLVWTALRSSPIAGTLTTASTLPGVAQLGFPGRLVEIDVTAALPAPAA